MIDYQKDLEKIKNLQVGQECTVFWSEESGGIVRCLSPFTYDLYEIGHYGGFETYYDTFEWDEINWMLDIAYTWI